MKPILADNHGESGATSANDSTTWMLVFAAWIVATVASLGSLFFSEIMQLPPCVLCWYQRIGMYPLVLILAVGLLPLDRRVVRYASPLVAVGWLIAVYHNLIYFGLLSEEASPCRQGVPCTAVQIEWFGFITIPIMSLTAFSMLAVLLFIIQTRR